MTKTDESNNNIPIFESGDVAFSFQSWLDLETAMSEERWLSDRDEYTSLDSARILLTVAHFIEALVTKERIGFFGRDLDIPMDVSYELPVRRMFPLEITYPEFESKLSRSDPALLNELKSASSEYVSFLKRQVDFDSLTKFDQDFIEDLGRILLGDMLRAQHIGVPFSPTPLESGACLYKIARSNVSQTDAGRAAIRIIESARVPMAEITNERMAAQIYDLRVPAVFAAVAHNSKDLQDLLRVALQMRRIPEAEAFRKWTREVDNDRNLERIMKSLNEIQGLSDALAKGIEQKPREVQLQLGVSFIGSFQIAVPIKLARRRERHPTFLKTIYSESCEVESLDQEIRRIFGSPIGDAAGSLYRLKLLG